MRINKYEHAALTIDEAGRRLIIDPGSFTQPLDELSNVDAVVLTHEHPDHWTPAHLNRIREYAGEVPIYGPPGLAAAASDFPIIVVNAGDTVEAGAFTLTFFGGTHNVIHESIPLVDNVGVLVNEKLYYPGDSYAVPEGIEVDTLAAPLGAPWLKIGDAMDFVLAVAPRRAFGTHDMTLSVIGRNMHRDRLKWATEKAAGEFFELDPGDHLDI